MKPSFSFTAWIHCDTCNRCTLPDHSCSGPKDGCFICGVLDHKRSNCPNIGNSRRANKLVEFFCFLEKRLLTSGFLGAIYRSTKLSEDSGVLNRHSHHYVLFPWIAGQALRQVNSVCILDGLHKIAKIQEEVGTFTSPMPHMKLYI